MAIQIEVHKLYLVGILFPDCLNEPSPSKLIPLSGEWHTKDVVPSRKNVRNVRSLHVGLILHYDASSHIAIVFLGTASPRHPHRCIPWIGTPRMPHQTREVLLPDPSGAFSQYQGYLNFTHAIRVLVIHEGRAVYLNTPGLGEEVDMQHCGQGGELLDISVPPPQVEVLKSLHALYWMGKRYNLDGSLIEKDGQDSDAEGATDFEVPCISSFQASSSNSSSQCLMVNEYLNPVDASEFAYKMAKVLHWEALRGDQIEMVKGDDDLLDSSNLSKCVIEPLTLDALRRHSEDSLNDGCVRCVHNFFFKTSDKCLVRSKTI